MARNTRKYGMAHHTIKYWQLRGREYRSLRGYTYAVDVIAASISYYLAQADKRHPLDSAYTAAYPVRQLAHYCIALAALDPVRLRLLLTTGKTTY